jgi:ribosomal protein L11 methyltransferase
MKHYPAIEVRDADADLTLAAVDDFAPIAVEERDDSVRIFFSTPASRDGACAALQATHRVSSVDVPDDDWARRSQDSLQPITVGRITVTPPWANTRQSSHITIVIQPSMGFGTGHHSTTRLCLEALQSIDLNNAFVLDVGTGSGVLAIAAVRLGAARATGIDRDSDAIQSATENLALNRDARNVSFEKSDLTTEPLPPAQVVTANLTAGLLVRAAAALRAAVGPGGKLIVSGLLLPERTDVVRAFAPWAIEWERTEENWVGLMFARPIESERPIESRYRSS